MSSPPISDSPPPAPRTISPALQIDSHDKNSEAPQRPDCNRSSEQSPFPAFAAGHIYKHNILPAPDAEASAPSFWQRPHRFPLSRLWSLGRSGGLCRPPFPLLSAHSQPRAGHASERPPPDIPPPSFFGSFYESCRPPAWHPQALPDVYYQDPHGAE